MPNIYRKQGGRAGDTTHGSCVSASQNGTPRRSRLAYAVVGRVAGGTTVRIVCTAHGTTMTGVYGTTSVWDRLDTGSWISDANVYTGSNNPVAPSLEADHPAVLTRRLVARARPKWPEWSDRVRGPEAGRSEQ